MQVLVGAADDSWLKVGLFFGGRRTQRDTLYKVIYALTANC